MLQQKQGFGNSLRSSFAITLTICAMIAGCDNQQKNASRVATTPQEEYHADNDIAMTVKSIADAISVGEPLDSNYNYEGILTDGQGTPLYTDLHGTPGAWRVDVIGDSEAVVRNLYLGDLLQNDLEAYIVTSLSLNEQPAPTDEEYDNQDILLRRYAFNGGTITFETRYGMAPNGMEGPILKIIIRSDNPDTNSNAT